MKLYLIEALAITRKYQHESIMGYAIASADQQVYDWLFSDPKTPHGVEISTGWKYYDDEVDEEEQETFKEKCLRLRGNINFVNNPESDVYGWKEIAEVSAEEAEISTQLGIAVNLNQEAIAPD